MDDHIFENAQQQAEGSAETKDQQDQLNLNRNTLSANRYQQHNSDGIQQSVDERPTISVVIDQDEEEEPTEEEGTATITPETNYQDHNYFSGKPQLQAAHSDVQQHKLDFPVLHGLDIDDSEEFDMSPTLPRVQHQMQRQAVRRFTSPNHGGFLGHVSYGRHPKMGQPIQQKYPSGLPQSHFNSPMIAYPRQHQELSRRESHQLPPTLRPSASRPRLQSTASVAAGSGFGGSHAPFPISRAATHSLPPPLSHPLQRRSTGNYCVEERKSPYLMAECSGVPTPMVVPRVSSSRGRTPTTRQRQNSMQLMYDDHSFDEINSNQQAMMLQRGYEHDEGSFIAPPPNEPQPRYSPTQRKTTSAPKVQRQSHSVMQRESMLKRNTVVDAIVDEEMENAKFFSQQRQKAPNVGQGRGRKPKNVQNDELSQSYEQLQQQDSSKPPEDPFPCQQQQMAPPSFRQHSQQQQYENSIDSAIDSVVRGDALVMQQHFVPSMTTPSPTLAQFIQANQNSTASPIKQQSFYGKQLSAGAALSQQLPHMTSAHQLNSQRLEDLAELAQASSHLLQQTTSSMLRAPYQQQQQQQFQPQQQQQTLHFKVVATDTLQQSLPPQESSRQQVFTVQQHQEQSNIQEQVKSYVAPDEDELKNKKLTRKSVGTKPPRKLTKKQMATIQQEAGQILPIPANEPVLEQKKTMNTRGKNKSATEAEITQQKDGTRRVSAPQQSSIANQSEKRLGERPSRVVAKKKNQKETKQEGWDESEDYVTRCLCGMQHTDSFMIQCDSCDVWQHGVCMGVTPKTVPDQYFCEQCQQRPLKRTAIQAAALQKRHLAFVKQSKAKKAATKMQKMKRMSAPFAIKSRASLGIGIREGQIQKRKKGIPGDGLSSSFSEGVIQRGQRGRKQNTSKSFEGSASPSVERPFVVLENHYSRGVKTIMSAYQGVAPQINLKQLERIKNEPITRQMFVAPNVEGLVATPVRTLQVPSDSLLIEFFGAISLLSDIRARTPQRINQHNFTFIYNGLGEGNEIFVDASKVGSDARSARRSCRPNALIRHAFLDGKLRFFLFAATAIDKSTEVTIPFDFDFWESKTQLDCACGLKKGCPVQEFNEALMNPITFQSIKMAKKAQMRLNPDSESASKSQSKNDAALQPNSESSSSALPSIKTETKSPKKEIDAKDEEKEQRAQLWGHHLRPRKASSSMAMASENFSSPKWAADPQKRTRMSVAASRDQGSPELGFKTVEENAKLKADEVTDKSEAKRPRDNSTTQSPKQLPKPSTSGLALLANAYRRSVPLSLGKNKKPEMPSTSPRRGRGRPPKNANVIKLEVEELQPKLEPPPQTQTPEKMTREERKIAAAIAIVESVEREKEKKRKASLSLTQNDGSPTKKQKMTESPRKIAKHSGEGQFEQLVAEFTEVVRAKTMGKKEDFKLPSDFEELKMKYAKEKVKEAAKPLKKSPRKKDKSMAKIVPISKYPKELQKDSFAVEKVKEEPAKQQNIPEEPDEKEKAEEGKSTATGEVVPETARPPNTKAMKKITIDEYKKKRMAEKNTTPMEKQEQKEGEEGGASKIAGPTIRQSPRKSFIPSVGGNLSSVPIQQLEDFPGNVFGTSTTSTATAYKHIPSPTIEDLKKRIFGNSEGLTVKTSLPLEVQEASSSSFLTFSGSGTGHSHPLPDVRPPTPSSQSQREQQPRQSLDDRLRSRFVSPLSGAGRKK